MKKRPAAQPVARRPAAGPRRLERGEIIDQTILPPTRQVLSRHALHRRLRPLLRRWLRGTCNWNRFEIGDYRFVIFDTEVEPGTLVYVQFWSEPLEPVSWEVSSGRWDPAVDAWLTGERSKRIEALGFRIGGTAENFQREVRIDSSAALDQAAKTVVDLFYDAFEYRGATPIRVQMHFDGRSQTNRTLDALTPQDLGKLFARAGFRVTEGQDANDDGDEETVLRCSTEGTRTRVRFGEQVEDQDLYRAAWLEVALPALPDLLADLQEEGTAPEDLPAEMEASTVLSFSGGVTAAWIEARLVEWRDMIRGHRREMQRQKRRAAMRLGPAKLVH